MNKLMCHSLIAFSFFGMHSSHAEISFEQELKQGCAKLSQYKQLGQKFYNQKNYKKALEQFKDQAAWTPFAKRMVKSLELIFQIKRWLLLTTMWA